MKYFILVILFWSCKSKPAGDYSPKEYLVKVTYQDRTVDTFHVKAVTEPFLSNGNFGINEGAGVFALRTTTLASGVRSIKILRKSPETQE